MFRYVTKVPCPRLGGRNILSAHTGFDANLSILGEICCALHAHATYVCRILVQVLDLERSTELIALLRATGSAFSISLRHPIIRCPNRLPQMGL